MPVSDDAAARNGAGVRPLRTWRSGETVIGGHDVVVIGGSLGSTAVLQRIVSGLPADLDAAVLIATHVSNTGSSHLADILARAGPLPVSEAVDGERVQAGRIHVAVPDHHLLLMGGTVFLGSGPRENMARPAIDPLFRSAAFDAGSRVVGVLLSGLLNDGASGLRAIRERRGLAVVQEPADAEADAMPLAAMEIGAVDIAAPAERLADVIADLVAEPAPPAPAASSALELEVEIAAGARLGSERLVAVGRPAPLTCPHCAGVMSEITEEGPLRFRCQIGHALTAEALIEAQKDGFEEAVRISMRMMEERVDLVSRMAAAARARGLAATADLYEARSAEYLCHARALRAAATSLMRSGRRRGGASP